MSDKKKKETITLSNESGDHEFEQSHAERILQWDVDHNSVNWTLHDSKLKFENGKIITGTSN